jgi:hypothetical protein
VNFEVALNNHEDFEIEFNACCGLPHCGTTLRLPKSKYGEAL